MICLLLLLGWKSDLPDKLQEFLANPEKFMIVSRDTEPLVTGTQPAGDGDHPNSKSYGSSSQPLGTAHPPTNGQPVRSFLPSGFREIPDRHKSEFSSECAIKTIKATGGCMYAGVSFKILKDEDLYKRLRDPAQQFLIRVWHLMDVESFMTFPIFVTVVHKQGETSRKELETAEEYKQFLMRKESLTSYSESNIELQNIANLLNITIHCFTYTKTSSTWYHFYPMDNIVGFSEWAYAVHDEKNTVVLYHELDNHFEVIVTSPADSVPSPSSLGNGVYVPSPDHTDQVDVASEDHVNSPAEVTNAANDPSQECYPSPSYDYVTTAAYVPSPCFMSSQADQVSAFQWPNLEDGTSAAYLSSQACVESSAYVSSTGYVPSPGYVQSPAYVPSPDYGPSQAYSQSPAYVPSPTYVHSPANVHSPAYVPISAYVQSPAYEQSPTNVPSPVYVPTPSHISSPVHVPSEAFLPSHNNGGISAAVPNSAMVTSPAHVTNPDPVATPGCVTSHLMWSVQGWS